MNMMKKNGGFTLVELIVVIAILAILAGVAVPAYTGYIAKAEEAADLQALSTVNTAVQGLAAVEGVTVTGITVNGDGIVTVTPDVEFDQEDIETLTGSVDGLFDDDFAGATWAAGKWTLS